MKHWLTVSEVADALQLSTSAVYRLLNRGELEGRKWGGSWRVHRDVVFPPHGNNT